MHSAPYPWPRLTLIADGLTLERGGRLVLADLSFEVRSGEVLLLTGPNGVGKTTLLRAVAGFLPPVEGRIICQSAGSTASLDIERAELCHYVGHLNAIKSNLTAFENLAFWSDFLGPGAASAALPGNGPHAALRALDLADLADVPAGYLSAGQKRRLGLARLLVADRPVWLLDEPTASLDAHSADLLAGIVRAHVERGGMTLAATHLPLGLAGARELRLGSRTQAGAEAGPAP